MADVVYKPGHWNQSCLVLVAQIEERSDKRLLVDEMQAVIQTRRRAFCAASAPIFLHIFTNFHFLMRK